MAGGQRAALLLTCPGTGALRVERHRQRDRELRVADPERARRGAASRLATRERRASSPSAQTLIAVAPWSTIPERCWELSRLRTEPGIARASSSAPLRAIPADGSHCHGGSFPGRGGDPPNRRVCRSIAKVILPGVWRGRLRSLSRRPRLFFAGAISVRDGELIAPTALGRVERLVGALNPFPPRFVGT